MKGISSRCNYVWIALGVLLLSVAAFSTQWVPGGALAQPANPFSSGAFAASSSTGGNPALTGVPLRENWWAIVPGIDPTIGLSLCTGASRKIQPRSSHFALSGLIGRARPSYNAIWSGNSRAR